MRKREPILNSVFRYGSCPTRMDFSRNYLHLHYSLVASSYRMARIKSNHELINSNPMPLPCLSHAVPHANAACSKHKLHTLCTILRHTYFNHRPRWTFYLCKRHYIGRTAPHPTPPTHPSSLCTSRHVCFAHSGKVNSLKSSTCSIYPHPE